MRKYNLGFISDEEIYEHVKATVKSYRREITLKQFNENIIDPIKLTFDSKVYGKNIQESINDECYRQIDKSNTNKIGYFHQNLFKYAGNGWNVPSQGFDVENNLLHIYVEMKNKHNTMNSASSQKTYMKMQAKLLEDDEATCYLVEAISSKSKDDVWKISLDGQSRSHKKIRRMSMDKFYELVFGDKLAFYKLCMVLPTIIEDVINENDEFTLKNTVYEELQSKNGDLQLSLFLLAFSTYEGFEMYNTQK
ncbi:MAG: Eco47II family restriction endonuclease [Muribaculaceae bacterium]|nr:Eco47II family restriction endonuclease [Muribaculaceae bacterium]MBQ3606237.1 Eco47II family restriction endonuclease [Muribaculaceae bacterium]MBQ7854552.1 Eco47II family restriction endonuclease [Muribaculaceae bacterium]MBR3830929.1 Eco47II family restriction endonuclease [Muribaculaceae bacterium]